MNRIYRTLGTVAMEPKGEWNSETYYEKLNTVLYNDSTYMAKDAVVGERPSESSKWQLIGGGVTKDYLDSQINQFKVFEKEQTIYFGAFFDKDTPPNSYFYASSNGEAFKRISTIPWNTARDSDIIFYNNKFYALTTETNEDLSIADLYVSDDLEQWTKKSLYIDFNQPSTYRNYPCDWFIDDNGDVYLTGAYQVGTMVSSETGDTYRDFRLYIVKVLNMDFDNFTLGQPIILDDFNYNLIDPHIIKKNNTYYMFAKKEISDETFRGGTIQTFTSSDLTTWTRISVTIDSINNYHYEAPCVIKIGNTYYMYIDNYSGDNGEFMQFITSSDLINWSSPSPLQTESYPTRHGTVRKINGIGQKIVSSYASTHSNDYINLYRKSINLPYLSSRTNNKYIEIATFTFNQNYTSLKIIFNLKDIENSLYDSDIEINIYKSTVFKVDFKEYYNKFYNRNKLKLVNTGENEFKLYYCTLTTTNCKPCITIKNVIASNSIVNFNEKLSLLNEYTTGTEYIPAVGKLHLSISDVFRIEGISTLENETSITAKFTRIANFQSFSCIIFGRNNCILFQAQINNNGIIVDYHAYDLTAQNKSYTLTTDDTEHTITLSGLNAYDEYTLLINDTTLGDIVFSK